MAGCGAKGARRGRPSAPLARAFGPIACHSANFLHAGAATVGQLGEQRAQLQEVHLTVAGFVETLGQAGREAKKLDSTFSLPYSTTILHSTVLTTTTGGT